MTLEASAVSSASTATRGRSQLNRYFVAGPIGLLLWAGTAASMFSLDHSSTTSLAVTLLIWVNITLLVGALTAEVARRPYSLHGMHLLCLFLFLGAPALFQYTIGSFAVAGPIDMYREEIPHAVTGVFLWIVAYVVAYELHRHFDRSNTTGPMTRFLGREVSNARATVLLMLALPVLIYLGVVIGLTGVSSRAGAHEVSNEFALAHGDLLGGGLALFLINHLLLRAFPIFALVTAMLVMRQRPILRQPFLLGIFLLVAVGVVLADNPFAAPRIWQVSCLFAAFAPWFFARLRTGWAVVVTSLAGLTVLPALSFNRHAQSFGEWWAWFRSSGLASPLDYLAHSTDTDSLGMLVLCVRWTFLNGYQSGLQILSGLLAWFPRSIWSGKGIGTGRMVTRDLGFEFNNLAPPIVAEPMVDFGLLGVPFLASLLGLMFSRLDHIYWSTSHERTAPTRVIDVILPFWLGLTVLLTRGDLMAAVVFILAFTFWIVPLGLGAPLPTPEQRSTKAPAH